MSLESITDRIRQKLAYAAQIDARIKFDFAEEGCIFLDATTNPPVLSHEDEEADLTFLCTLETMENILSGTQDPNLAFMFGKLKMQGDMKLAMKLNALLED
jgi:putative sterol carrier protein